MSEEEMRDSINNHPESSIFYTELCVQYETVWGITIYRTYLTAPVIIASLAQGDVPLGPAYGRSAEILFIFRQKETKKKFKLSSRLQFDVPLSLKLDGMTLMEKK